MTEVERSARRAIMRVAGSIHEYTAAAWRTEPITRAERTRRVEKDGEGGREENDENAHAGHCRRQPGPTRAAAGGHATTAHTGDGHLLLPPNDGEHARMNMLEEEAPSSESPEQAAARSGASSAGSAKRKQTARLTS